MVALSGMLSVRVPAIATEYSIPCGLEANSSCFQIDRDIYIINVMRQVIERHFLRHLEETIPKRLDTESVQLLVPEDSNNAIRRAEITNEIGTLESSLKVLSKTC